MFNDYFSSNEANGYELFEPRTPLNSQVPIDFSDDAYTNSLKGHSRGNNHQTCHQTNQPTTNYQTVHVKMGEHGTITIAGQRYLKLGKINLYDPFKDTNVSNQQYIGVLDTFTGNVVCLDMDILYKQFIAQNKDIVQSQRYTFNLSTEVKDIVVKAIIEREKVTNNVKYV